MPDIRPISDLCNYNNVVRNVRYGNQVFLTKNGQGTIVMVNMQEFDEMQRQIALYQFQLEMKKGEQSILEEGAISLKNIRAELEI